MSIKTILVPVELGEHLPAIFETALLLGRACDGYIAGVGLGITYMVVGPMGGMVVATQEVVDQPAIEELRHKFTEFMGAKAIKSTETPAASLSWAWHGDEIVTDVELGNLSRVFDVTVIGRPDSSMSAPRVGTVESVLFEGGRPVLIAPPEPPETIGKTILVSWNCSTESARSVSFAMPLLEAAERVVVLTVEDALVAGPSGRDLRTMLKAHDIEAEEMSLPGSVSTAGEITMGKAHEIGCDLIIKGAYTHSRLRQMVFGGPTSHLIHGTDLPLLLAS